MKILLVQDSATLRYAMRNYIIEAGHTPLIAQSGEEALQMLETTPVDMIIMDVEMPGLNGFETTRLIREWLGGYWIPIIFVTGRNEDESYREGIEAGGDDYLIKPVSAMIIKPKIRAMERITEMRDQFNQVHANATNVYSYIAPGGAHCVSQDSNYYSVTSGNVTLASWVGGLLTGQNITKAVDCTPNCL